MNILIVDDEKLIRDVVKEYSKNEGYNVFEAKDGIEALDKVREYDIDLIVLDIMMPNMDGLTFLKELKKEKNIPVIILSARSEEYDKLAGFELGIDDYLAKPFSPKELMARIKAILKRYKRSSSNIYKYKDLTVNYDAHSVTIENKEVNLTPKEYELLCLFIDNENIALSRETLLDKIWGYDFYGDFRTVDTHIKMLRNNLGKYRDLIVTVRGVGYKYVTKNKE